MLVTIPKKWFENCKGKKYSWGGGDPSTSYVRVGNTFEVAVQIYLHVPNDEIRLREGKQGADCGIDLIIRSTKYQCKSCFLDGNKSFILLDKTVNADCDYYALGKVYEDYKQCEMTAILRTNELLSLIEVGKIVWHEEYSKWCWILAQSSRSWLNEQRKKKMIIESVHQNIPCLIYKKAKK